MSRKKKPTDRANMKEKMYTYMMLMGCDGDHQSTVAKELGRRVWKRKGRLSQNRCERLMYLLLASDNCALLTFAVSLGRLIWIDYLRAKRRRFEKRLAVRIKKRTNRKKKSKRKRSRRLRKVMMIKERKGKMHRRYKVVMVLDLGPRCRAVVRRRVAKRGARKTVLGSLMYRFAMAMSVLSDRNLCIRSEWEFWTICFVQEVYGFWRSVAFGDGLSDALDPIARKFGLYVVSWDLLERLESCYGCSSSGSHLGRRKVE